MNEKNRTLGMAAGLFLALALWLLPRAAQGQTFQLLHSYPSQNGTLDNPLIKGIDGIIYGLVFTNNGTNGSLVRVDSNGNVTNLVHFNQAISSLVQGRDGSFYCAGVAVGVVQMLRINPDGTLTELGVFTHGGPTAWVQGSDDNFYGITHGVESGTTLKITGDGTLFRMTPSGSLTTLIQFDGTNGGGGLPGDLIQGGDGNLYGLTSINEGGWFSDTFFSATTNGSLTTLDSWSQVFESTVFINPGPDNLVFGSDGNLYGTSFFGDAGLGSVVRVTPDGTMTTLADFDGNNGMHPGAALVLAHDGNFYGTTLEGGDSFGNPNALNGEGYGTVFQMTPDGTLTTIHSFDGSDGQSPEIPLVEGPDGNLYGTTYSGTQAITGSGMLFRIVMPPTLTIAQGGNQLVLSWPTNAAGFVLEAADSLSSSTTWSTNSDTPIITGGQNTITVSNPTGSKFYRLQK